MNLESALYILLGLSAFCFVVWLLVTYVAKASPAREIVIGVAVILLLLVLIPYVGPLLHGHAPR